MILTRLPIGGYKFLDEEHEDLDKIRKYFEEVEAIHKVGKPGSNDTKMPSWDTFFPHDTEGVGQGFFIEADVHIPPDRHEYLEGLFGRHLHLNLAPSFSNLDVVCATWESEMLLVYCYRIFFDRS